MESVLPLFLFMMIAGLLLSNIVLLMEILFNNNNQILRAVNFLSQSTASPELQAAHRLNKEENIRLDKHRNKQR